MTLRYPDALLCELCFQNAEYYGEIFPNHDLIFHDGVFKICNGHDEIIRFHAPPVKDPCDGLSEDAEDLFCNDPSNDSINNAYFKYHEDFRKDFRFSPQLGEEIIIACRQVGYNSSKDGWLDYWIVNRASKMIEKRVVS